MAISSFVVSCVAVLVSCGALWYARGQNLAANRAAKAASLSAEAAIAAERRQRKVDERNRVVWSIQPVDRFDYVLTNEGTESAYGVRIEPDNIRIVTNSVYTQFPAGYAEPIRLAPTKGFGSSFATMEGIKKYSLTITWHHDPSLTDDQQRQLLLFR